MNDALAHSRLTHVLLTGVAALALGYPETLLECGPRGQHPHMLSFSMREVEQATPGLLHIGRVSRVRRRIIEVFQADRHQIPTGTFRMRVAIDQLPKAGTVIRLT